MADHSIDISCTGPTPQNTTVVKDDNVTFDNTTGAQVTITFEHPGVFQHSQGRTITIAKNDHATLRINQINQGTGFSYPDCEEALGTRSGRIDP